MKTLSLTILFVAFASFTNALPQGGSCDSVAICNDICGKQGLVSCLPCPLCQTGVPKVFGAEKYSYLETRRKLMQGKQCSRLCLRSEMNQMMDDVGCLGHGGGVICVQNCLVVFSNALLRCPVQDMSSWDIFTGAVEHCRAASTHIAKHKIESISTDVGITNLAYQAAYEVPKKKFMITAKESCHMCPLEQRQPPSCRMLFIRKLAHKRMLVVTEWVH